MVKNISDRLGNLQSEFIGMILNAKFENPYRDDLREYLKNEVKDQKNI